jgi:hypothetical protein
MSVAVRGKKYGTQPGWALDPKTKLELKIRENIRKLPAKHGGKLYDPEVEQAIKNKSISMADANKVNAIQEMMRKERELKAGNQEGDGSDHNTGRNDAVIYEHKRNK